MKAVLISIQPKWVEKIASGEKTIEVRKNRPKIETPFKCYIYCTKGKDLLREVDCCNSRTGIHKTNYKIINLDYCTNKIANGKVIGEFTCDRIEDLRYVPTKYYGQPQGTYEEIVCANSCLTVEEIKAYAKGKTIYGWNISDLKIYDKPRELSEFWAIKCSNKRNGCIGCEVKPNCIKTITRPPQSWAYCEIGE